VILLKAKCGLIITFNMKTDTAEIDLVDKWRLGTVSDKVVLNLGKYGKIKVGEIASLEWINRKK